MFNTSSLSIHLLMDTGCFHGLATANNAAMNIKGMYLFKLGLSRWLSGKKSACSARDADSMPGSDRPPGEGNGNPLQYSYLGNPMDREAWRATIHGVTKE